MNILICNKYFFTTGGPERYMFQLMKLLQDKGHKALPFSINFTQNEPTEYKKYFASPPLGLDNPKYENANASLIDKIRFLFRACYSLEAKRKVANIAKIEKIDVAYLLNICNYLSPSIIDGLKKKGIPVVMRLSDYNLFCPEYHFYRNGKVCMLCNDSLFNAVRYRCCKGSLGLSLAKASVVFFHRILKIYNKVDAFITPSLKMREEMLKHGFPSNKIIPLNSFINLKEYQPSYKNKGYILYFGRLSREKGLLTLIKAFSNLKNDIHLTIAGSGDHEEELKKFSQDNNIKNIEFKGFLDQTELIKLIQHAIFTVIPSLWFDNSPMSIYESFAVGKPVIASDIAGISEIVDHKVNGLLFQIGNSEDLAEKMDYLLDNRQKVMEMGKNARYKAETKFSPQTHYETLIKIFNNLKNDINSPKIKK